MSLFSACVEAAFQKAKTLLWPIHKNVWLKLFVLYLFTGGCASSIGNIGNLQSFKNIPKSSTQPAEPAPDLEKKAPDVVLKFIADSKPIILSLWEKARPYLYAAIIGAIILGLILFVTGLWLTSRLQITLISVLREGIVDIGRHWRQTATLGWTLFVFNLWLYTASFLIFMPLIGIGAAGVYYGVKHSSIGVVILSGAGLLIFFFVAVAVGALFWIVMKFLPVVMCEFNESPIVGVRRMWMWAREHKSKTFFGVLLYAALAVGIGIATVSVLAVIAVVGVVFAVLVSLALATVAKGAAIKAILVSLGVFAAVVFALLLLILGAVPTGTFFAYLRMELISSALSRTPQSSLHVEA